MNSTIQTTYKVSNTHEISVDYQGANYLIIYGKHINGWFIACPNWQFCTEAASPDDVFYNTEKLSRVIEDEQTACAIAEAIKEHFNNAVKEIGGFRYA